MIALAKLGDDIEKGLEIAARQRIEHPEKPDPTDAPPLGELFVMADQLPFDQQRQGAREWLTVRMMRGAMEGNGIRRLLDELRQRT